jgi:hypothetical protein
VSFSPGSLPAPTRHRAFLKEIDICIKIKYLCRFKHQGKPKIDNYHPAFFLSRIFAVREPGRRARLQALGRNGKLKIPYLVQTENAATIYSVAFQSGRRPGAGTA